MKKSLLTCLMAVPIFYGHAQSITNAQSNELETLLQKVSSLGHQSGSVKEFFNQEEISQIRTFKNNQNSLLFHALNGHTHVDGINEVSTSIGSDQGAYGTLVSFPLDNPSVLNPLGNGSGGSEFEGAGAISHTNPELGYAVDITGKFYRINTTSGVYTYLGNIGVGDINGMEFNPVDGVLYATTSTKLYTLNPDNVTANLIGDLNTTGIAIALAIDGNGNAFTYDIMDDSLYSVNLSTGNSTLIGSIGFDANYGQGMGWDAATNTIYMAAFNNTAFAPELRSVNTSTGLTTFLGTINSSDLSQISWVSFMGDLPVAECNVNYEGSLEEGLGSDESYMHANDFEVAANTAFHIEKYQFRVFNNISTGKILFYTDQNGEPGEMIYETDYIAPSSQEFVTVWEDWLNVYDVVFDFPTPVILNGGSETTKYWVAFAYQYGDEMDANFFETSDVVTNSVTYISIDGGNIWDPNSSSLDAAFKLIGDCQPIQEVLCNVNYEGSLEEGLGSDESYMHANDFEVAANTAFHIEKYQFRVFNNISTGKILFYTDQNGEPGEMIYETDYIAPSSQEFVTVWEDWLNVYDVVFDFATPVILNGGSETTKYWVAFAYQYGDEMDANFFETSDVVTNSVTYISIDGGNIWDPNSSSLDAAFKLIGECTTLGMADTTDFEFAYYPNPVKDVLNINSQKEIKSVQVFNLAGQEVNRINHVNGQVQLNSLPKGIYVFRVVLEGGFVETFKIIKK